MTSKQKLQEYFKSIDWPWSNSNLLDELIFSHKNQRQYLLDENKFGLNLLPWERKIYNWIRERVFARIRIVDLEIH